MGLLAAVSLIQRLRAMEETGGDAPSGFFAAGDAFSFFSAGFRAGILEAALLALLLPLALGVNSGAVAAFGEREADFSARCLVFVFCFGPSLASAVFWAGLARRRGGELSRKAAGSLAWGRAAGMAVGGVAVFFVFHALSLLADPENVRRLPRLGGAVFPADPAALLSAAAEAREPLRKSAVFLLFLCPLLGVFPFPASRLFGPRPRTPK